MERGLHGGWLDPDFKRAVPPRALRLCRDNGNLHLVRSRQSKGRERRWKFLNGMTTMIQCKVAHLFEISRREWKRLQIGKQRFGFSPLVERIAVQPEPRTRKEEEDGENDTRDRKKPMWKMRSLRQRLHTHLIGQPTRIGSSRLLVGEARLHVLTRPASYVITAPYGFCSSPNWLATQSHSLLCRIQVSVNRP